MQNKEFCVINIVIGIAMSKVCLIRLICLVLIIKTFQIRSPVRLLDYTVSQQHLQPRYHNTNI